MWHMRMSRVFGVIPSSKRRTTSAASSAGTGTLIWFITIPSRRSRCRKVVSMRP